MSCSEISLELLPGELWWGGQVDDGMKMPLGIEKFTRSLDPNTSTNQAVPLLLSNKGRYVWCDNSIVYSIVEGKLKVKSKRGGIVTDEGFETLKEAYSEAQKRFFPPSGKTPDDLFFTVPQYNTWIELMYEQNEADILKYAESIVSNGMPAGLLMIDCGWQIYNGMWDFYPGRFENPALMVRKLHEMGFKVMLWTCPFVTCDTVVYRYLRDKGFLLKNEDGTVAIREWWDGFSAVLDMTNHDAINWYDEQNKYLVKKYGIDGFKFDAGDARFYKDTDLCSVPSEANGHCEAFAKYGLNYELNEYRACWKNGGQPLVQRLSDKQHSWGEYGLASLIPNGLLQGLIGYAFTCPDMIGGGDYINFLENAKSLDQELFVRYAQCSALFPMMQFSANPFRVLNKENRGYCLEAARLHARFGRYILKLAENAGRTGEPIIRHMEYVFPNKGYELVNDQFMLGDDILVAPVISKNSYKRIVKFPEGEWIGDDSSTISGPCSIEISVPLSRLPWYIRKGKSI